jgi:hypothetical protein
VREVVVVAAAQVRKRGPAAPDLVARRLEQEVVQGRDRGLAVRAAGLEAVDPCL